MNMFLAGYRLAFLGITAVSMIFTSNQLSLILFSLGWWPSMENRVALRAVHEHSKDFKTGF